MSERPNDLDLDLDHKHKLDTLAPPSHRHAELEWAPETGPEAAGEPTSNNLRDLPLCVPSLTNSPGCAPMDSPHSTSLTPPTPPTPRTPRTPLTSPGSRMRTAAPLRRVRSVRVDAWSSPAATTWTRTRKTVRKVNRQPHSTNWALPF
jgi:hypothetical protein